MTSVTLVLEYFSFIDLEDLGVKISGLLTPRGDLFFLNFSLKRENLKKKEVFWKGKNKH